MAHAQQGQLSQGPITLRRWRIRDAKTLAILYEANQHELSATEPWRPADFYSELGQRRRISAALDRQDMLHFLILEGGGIVGTIGFEEVSKDGATADIGYWVDAAHRGRGIATKAVAIAVEYGFSRLRLNSIRANVDPANIASRRVLERNQFHLVGERRLGARDTDHLVFERQRPQ